VKTQYPVSLSATVKLDSSGNGAVQLGPQGSYVWELGAIAISTLNQSQTIVPSGTVYAGSAATAGYFVDDTFDARGNTTLKASGQTLYPGQYVFAQFSGGVPGDTATLRVSATQKTGYR
jgi:hypothetical protein